MATSGRPDERPVDRLSAADARRRLDLAADIAASSPIVDVHVHATEVVFRQTHYRPGAAGGELLQASDAGFRAPTVTGVRFDDPWRAGDRFDAATRNRVSRLLFTNAYQHTGRAVLREHMRLAGVNVALLLPVAPPDGGVADQMELLAAIRGQDADLPIAYSVPNPVPAAEISRDLERAVARFGVRAVKLHPNLTGIDIASAAGHERVDHLLAGCGRLALPLLVHGGRSPILADPRASQHATLANLARIDWSRTTAPVVIAHCGFFGCPREEIAADGLTALRRILDRHPNVFVDTSGLSLPVLVDVLRRLDHGRIVFGSDALYFPMWQAVVTLLSALDVAGFPLAESFAQIASHTPRALLQR
jgi:predicted TIM-barrel fold metal-dependent hydrolase